MKMRKYIFIILSVCLAGLVCGQAEARELLVRLEVGKGKYITSAPYGKLEIGGEKDNDRQMFTMSGLGSDKPADGDKVKLSYAPGGDVKPTYWIVNGETVSRDRKGNTFHLIKIEDAFILAVSEDKFIALSSDGRSLALINEKEKAVKLNILDVLGGG